MPAITLRKNYYFIIYVLCHKTFMLRVLYNTSYLESLGGIRQPDIVVKHQEIFMISEKKLITKT